MMKQAIVKEVVGTISTTEDSSFERTFGKDDDVEEEGDDVKRGDEDDDASCGEGGGGCHISP